MEIEAKFRAPDDVFAELLELSSLGPFELALAPTPELQHNIYYDTADRRLQATRHGLRIRHIGSRQIATLKSAATIDDGLYTRGEWEQDVAGDTPHEWPEGELRNRVLTLLGDAALEPIVEIHTTRQHIYAAKSGVEVAELSLDQGTMMAGNRNERFRELEIELLKGASRNDFDELLRLLRERFPLVPEPRSKLERARALRDA